jgi:putative oxidoreductase
LFSWLNNFQSLGALVMRLVLGVIMVRHGYDKVIPSGALYNFTHMVTRLHLPAWLGYISAFTEFFGGMLLIVGLLTRVAALMTAIDPPAWRPDGAELLRISTGALFHRPDAGLHRLRLVGAG